ncbi:MAG: hypothetical protein K2X77_16640 [Candidatus Obscuribacterales bacterium]|nr:hypothetical protein [Candidatus Obscuribacterales bacterium]
MNLKSLTFSRFTLAVQLTAGSLMFWCAPAFAVDDLKAGIASYQKQDYAQAAEALKRAAKKDPYNAVCHYYLANSLVYLSDTKGAATEYFTCFDLDPFGQAGQYSREALKKLKGPVSPVPGSGNAARTAPDSGASIRHAVGSIGRQTTEKGKFYQDNSQICARLVSDNATVYANRVSQSAEELVAEIREAYRGKMPESVEADLEEIRQKALYKAAWVREDAQQQAHRRMAAETKRSELVEKSASNLLALIAETPKVGKVKLKAAGTNLYVRNYAMEPLPTPEPLTAEWKLLPQAEGKAQRKGSRNI